MRSGASRSTVDRSGLGQIAAYGCDASYHAFYWGARLLPVTRSRAL